MANVDYKFYRTPGGSYAVLPGANIAAGSGLQEISFQEFKTGAQGRATMTPGMNTYDYLLKNDPTVKAAVDAAEAGKSVSYGITDDKGNLVSQQALDQEASYKQGVANGTLKEVDMGNGIKGYVPATGAAKFVPGSIPGSNPGQTIQHPTPTGTQNATATAGGQQAPMTNQGVTQAGVGGSAPVSSYTGPSVVDYLNSVGQDSSFSARANLAKSMGIEGYTGTASQNNKLLSNLRSSYIGNPAAATQVSAAPGTSTTPNVPDLSEQDRIIKEYADVSKALGLGDLKQQAEKVAKDIKDLNDQMAKEISDVNNTPWLSEQSRGKLINSVSSKYETKTSNLMEYEKLLDSQYQQGMDQVSSIVGKIETNLAKTMEIAQKKQEALDKLALGDIHPGEVGGREVLIDYNTRKIVADLGPAKTSGSGVGGATSNQLIDNERSLMTDFHNQPIVKDYNTILAKKLSVDRILDSKLGGPGDLAVVYEFMKGLDPTSVVRETEYATAAKSGNIFAGAYTRFNGYLKPEGGFLPENVKKSFQSIINSKLGVQKQLYDNVANQYAEIARRQGLNPSNVVVNYSAVNTPTNIQKSQFDNIQSSITIKGKTAYLPRSVWASVKDKDALLQEAKNDGFTLLIND